MSRLILMLVLFLTPATGAMACPDHQHPGRTQLELTGRDMWSPYVVTLRVGGPHALIDCGIRARGYVNQIPDVEMRLTRMGRYDRLHLRINADHCDPVLLLRDGAGNWHFDDDSGTGRTASLSLDNPPDGRYSLWAGTYTHAGCAARLTLETF